jgi:hypothetical protein
LPIIGDDGGGGGDDDGGRNVGVDATDGDAGRWRRLLPAGLRYRRDGGGGPPPTAGPVAPYGELDGFGLNLNTGGGHSAPHIEK